MLRLRLPALLLPIDLYGWMKPFLLLHFFVCRCTFLILPLSFLHLYDIRGRGRAQNSNYIHATAIVKSEF
eukprot:6192213-Pleurochrysis_carterae.AAC.3